MKLFLSSSTALTGLVLVAACGTPFSTPPADGNGGSGAGGGNGVTAVSSTGSAGGPCARPVPDVPAGWSGPIVYQVKSPGDPAADCPGADEPVLHSGLLDSDVCSCDCETHPSACQLTLTGRLGSCTGTLLANDTLQSNGCNSVSLGAGGYSATVLSAAAPTGACSASAVKLETPMPIWQKDWATCPVVPTIIEGQSCVETIPAGFDSNVCVMVSGTATCPDAYPNQLDLYRSYKDERACVAGSCGCNLDDLSCGGTISLYPLANCEGGGAQLMVGAIPDMDCVGTAVVASAVYSPVVYGQCYTGGSAQQIGDLIPTAPTTLCCLDAAET